MRDQRNHLPRTPLQDRTEVHVVSAPRVRKSKRWVKHDGLEVKARWLVVSWAAGLVIAIWFCHVLDRWKVVARSEVVVVAGQVVSCSVGEKILVHGKVDDVILFLELDTVIGDIAVA